MSTKERTKVVIDRTKWMRIVRREEDDYRATRYALDGTTPRVLDAMDAPSLLNRCGNMCCLGFVSKVLLDGVCSQEVIDRLLLDVGTPASILQKAAYSTDLSSTLDLKALVAALGPLLSRDTLGPPIWKTDPARNELLNYRNSPLTSDAIRLNDLFRSSEEHCDRDVKTREEKLVALFAEHGIDLVFEGEDLTNGSK